MALAFRLFIIAIILTVPTTAYTNECPKIDQSHEEWSTILTNWASDGLVNYSALQEEGLAPLDSYLNKLSATCAVDYVKWTREQRIAFWINAYNAFTVKLIVDNYPISSIRSIGLFPLAAFRQKFIPMPGLKGATISLNDIEHDTLRADFMEPRIHFALVCASIGCPEILNVAYRASDLDRQLDQQTRLFLSDVDKNRYDPESNTLYLSPIFKWFQADFEEASGSVAAYVGQYINDLGTRGQDIQIKYTKYDWSLNDQLPSN
jgi:hypothetical protein